MNDPWKKHNDLLGFRALGETFAKLIKSLDAGKVVSIEAGFGRGKTFFRTAWAEQLRKSGEVVVEIDVQQSDHSGDPVITFLGALVDALPRDEKGKGEAVIHSAKKLGTVGARTLAKIVLRSAADELIDLATEAAIDKLDDFDALDKLVTDLGDGMSKVAGQMIASQMAAEKVRKQELPEQLDALRAALTEGIDTDQVIIIIDELDRCHPDYAISVLEAMKLIFNQSGFVFCLMINADYLEKLAQHRFGNATNDEKYLDKFVDIRLRLEPEDEYIESAVIELAKGLPLKIPYGDDPAFGVPAAAKLAGKLAVLTKVSMRKAERILYKVELAMRCYSDQPLDPSLLVFLAFEEAIGHDISTDVFSRAKITPEAGLQVDKEAKARDRRGGPSDRDVLGELNHRVNEIAPELAGLPKERYMLPDDKNYHPWALVYNFLAPRYVPSHQKILNAVANFMVPDNSTN